MPPIVTGYIIFFGGVFCAIAFFRYMGLYERFLRSEPLLKLFILTSLVLLIAPGTIAFWFLSLPLIIYAVRKSDSEIALVSTYIFLAIVFPMFGKEPEVPGIGFVGYFGLPKILSLMLLFLIPKGYFKPNRGGNEKLLLLFVLLLCWGASREGNPITGFVRAATHNFLEFYLPYLAIVRLLDDLEKVRKAMAVFLFATIAHILPAMYEMVRLWNPYNLYYVHMGEKPPFLFKRFRSGFIRVSNVFVNPILFGYCSALAFVYGLYFLKLVKKGKKLIFIGGTLFCCIVAFSKGPYLGVLVALAYLFFFSSELPKAKLIGWGFVALSILAMTPVMDTIIGFIPFVGEISPESESYRTLLLERSWIVAQENLWFGTIKSEFYGHPAMQDLLQGQGIIDITNWYLQLLLEFGLFAVLCIVIIQVSTMWKLYRLAGFFKADKDNDYTSLCHIATAAILLSSVVAATVSNIDRLGTLHIIVLAIGQSVIYCLTREKEKRRADPWQSSASAVPDKA